MKTVGKLLPAALLLLAACATAKTQQDAALPDRGGVITPADIEAAGGVDTNAYDLVQRLHPEWLRKRGRGEAGDIVVYVNDDRLGGPGTLRSIPAESVLEIRFLNVAEAARYGTGHQHGVLLVQTR